MQGSFKGETGVAGAGQYKTRSPLVKLRVVFGRGWQGPCEAEAHTQAAVERIRKPSRNITATSLSALADFYEAGGTHIQRMRMAVSRMSSVGDLAC